MGFLTKEQILQAQDLKTETITVPEWGGEVIVRTITAKERDAFEKQLTQEEGGLENIRAKFVAATLVDEKNNLLFNEMQINDLGNKSASALDRVFAVGQKLAGLGTKDAEELSKN
jgi:hypothetical protein|tara:strand:+ start:612 stop:956 length:345 start_codon:yes stop_codon:yes gene_type:complete